MFEQVCLPAWFICLSTVILMCAAAAGEYQRGKIDGKIEEKENQMKREEKEYNGGSVSPNKGIRE